jgi:hypothetical protein
MSGAPFSVWDLMVVVGVDGRCQLPRTVAAMDTTVFRITACVNFVFGYLCMKISPIPDMPHMFPQVRKDTRSTNFITRTHHP